MVSIGDKKFINGEGLRGWTEWPPPADREFTADLPKDTVVSVLMVLPPDSDGEQVFAVQGELHGQELYSVVHERMLGDVS